MNTFTTKLVASAVGIQTQVSYTEAKALITLFSTFSINLVQRWILFSLNLNCANRCTWVRATFPLWGPCRAQPLGGAMYVVVYGNGLPGFAHGSSDFTITTVSTNSLLLFYMLSHKMKPKFY